MAGNCNSNDSNGLNRAEIDSVDSALEWKLIKALRTGSV
jgi:hypothetical protein